MNRKVILLGFVVSISLFIVSPTVGEFENELPDILAYKSASSLYLSIQKDHQHLSEQCLMINNFLEDLGDYMLMRSSVDSVVYYKTLPLKEESEYQYEDSTLTLYEWGGPYRFFLKTASSNYQVYFVPKQEYQLLATTTTGQWYLSITSDRVDAGIKRFDQLAQAMVVTKQYMFYLESQDEEMDYELWLKDDARYYLDDNGNFRVFQIDSGEMLEGEKAKQWEGKQEELSYLLLLLLTE